MLNLKAMSEQEVFDAVVNHLLTQKERSYSDSSTGRCAYRGNYGLKCAAGIFISDDQYHEDYEWVGNWYNLVSAGKVPSIHQDLIFRLQQIHDSVQPGGWESELERLANTWEPQLKFNPPAINV